MSITHTGAVSRGEASVPIKGKNDFLVVTSGSRIALLQDVALQHVYHKLYMMQATQGSIQVVELLWVDNKPEAKPLVCSTWMAGKHSVTGSIAAINRSGEIGSRICPVCHLPKRIDVRDPQLSFEVVGGSIHVVVAATTGSYMHAMTMSYVASKLRELKVEVFGTTPVKQYMSF